MSFNCIKVKANDNIPNDPRVSLEKATELTKTLAEIKAQYEDKNKEKKETERVEVQAEIVNKEDVKIEEIPF